MRDFVYYDPEHRRRAYDEVEQFGREWISYARSRPPTKPPPIPPLEDFRMDYSGGPPWIRWAMAIVKNDLEQEGHELPSITQERMLHLALLRRHELITRMQARQRKLEQKFGQKPEASTPRFAIGNDGATCSFPARPFHNRYGFGR